MKTLDEFDFRFQPSVEQKLAHELATGRYIGCAAALLDRLLHHSHTLVIQGESVATA